MFRAESYLKLIYIWGSLVLGFPDDDFSEILSLPAAYIGFFCLFAAILDRLSWNKGFYLSGFDNILDLSLGNLTHESAYNYLDLFSNFSSYLAKLSIFIIAFSIITSLLIRFGRLLPISLREPLIELLLLWGE